MKWENPGAGNRGRPKGIGRWVELVEALKSNPGEWALVGENEWVQSVRQGLIPRGCEVTCRGVNKPETGKAEKIYARYTGGEAI